MALEVIMIKKLWLLSLFTISVGALSAQTVVNFSSASDLTNNFRVLRDGTTPEVSYNGGVGSDGSSGYLKQNFVDDSGAAKYSYDADGAGAGTNFFSNGYVSTNIRYNVANVFFGLFFAPTTANAVGYQMRLDNSGALDNWDARYGINLTNNFSLGTTITNATTPNFSAGTSALGPAITTTTAFFNDRTLTTGSWLTMRMDVDTSVADRTLRYRMWDGPDGTGTLRLDQQITLQAGYYTGTGEFGFYSISAVANAYDLDKFTVAAVPEPSTYAMILFGLGALIFWQRRRANC